MHPYVEYKCNQINIIEYDILICRHLPVYDNYGYCTFYKHFKFNESTYMYTLKIFKPLLSLLCSACMLLYVFLYFYLRFCHDVVSQFWSYGFECPVVCYLFPPSLTLFPFHLFSFQNAIIFLNENIII